MATVLQKTSMQPMQIANRRARFQSLRTEHFTESVIREMSRLAIQHKAVNLAQGFPDFPAPAFLKKAAQEAISDDFNQYPMTWGIKPLRDAISAKYQHTYNLNYDPEREVTVCCGATEAMIATLLAVTNPGDEIVVFEPYYENYGPDAMMCGIERKFVKLHAPDWHFDPDELRRAFSKRTKAIIINTPNNPTGRVFDRASLELIAELCQEFDALAITDEIYEHILFDGTVHIPIATIPGMRDRTVLISSMSKTYSVTGWRVGWALASPDLTESIRKVHDFLTVGAPTPLQKAGVLALAMPDDFYKGVSTEYEERRSVMIDILEGAGFRCQRPKGAYYVMADISAFGYPNDMEFARHLVQNIGLAGVPGSSFFNDMSEGSQIMRFCFCKKLETLQEAKERLSKL
jgi:aspartate/methionine/tyrosine aminotransferase